MIKRFTRSISVLFLLLIIQPVSIIHTGGKIEIASKKAVVQTDTISTCLNRVNIPEQDLHWVYAPLNASELHTEEDYFFLAGQLIKSGAVNAGDCPAAGMGAREGFANACGMAAARPLVIQIQNAYDEAILQAWRDVGVPPILLKQMIRYESQFFPGQWGLVHFGLGHMTYLGARTALEWNRSLFNEICTYSGNNCDPFYIDLLSNTLINLMNASCPSCSMGIDLPKAQNSVHYLAETLLGYCNQTSQIVYNATKLHSSYTVGYSTIWKLTLMNYNVGPICVLNAVKNTYDWTQGPMKWSDIVRSVDSQECSRGVIYADQITENYYNYNP
jgi:hypothetical protein